MPHPRPARPHVSVGAAGRRARAGLVLMVAVLAIGAGVARADRAYVVQPGDTLYALAERFGTTVAALRTANALSGSLLRPGEVLRVPGSDEVAGYRTIIARGGETLADVAERVGRRTATLASANPVLARAGVRAGAPVSVPPADGTTVVVGPSDSLAGLARRAGVTVAQLARVNGLDPAAPLQVGRSVLLPVPSGGVSVAAADAAAPGHDGQAGTAPRAPAPGVGGSAATAAGSGSALAGYAGGDAPGARARLEAMQNAALLAAVIRLPQVRLSQDSFVAPVQGRLSSPFGWRALSVDGNHFHAGIDLAVPKGTPVHAARDGTVVQAAWDGTYGNAVFLDHGDGSQTRYAHLSRIAVHVGQRLRQGDVLGYAGSTGWSTGPHVHFELRFDGRAVNPLDYLRGAVAR